MLTDLTPLLARSAAAAAQPEVTSWIGLLGLIVTGLFTLISTLAVSRFTGRGRQPGAASAPEDPEPTRTVQVPDAGLGSTSHQVPVALAGAVEGLASTVSSMQLRLAETSNHLNDVRRRLDEVEEDRDILATVVRALRDWELQGRPTPPGPPEVTALALRLLDSLHTRD